MIVGARGSLGAALSTRYEAAGWSVQRAVRRDGIEGEWECDLSLPEQVDRLAARALGEFDLCAVVAGTSAVGRAADVRADAYRRCLEVNFLAPLALIQALARGERPCRTFILILSGAAEFLVPGMGPYSISKRALRDYLCLARTEGSFPECRLLTVWPGGIEGEFDRKTVLHGSFRLPRNRSLRPPRVVADAIFRAESEGASQLVLDHLPHALGWIQGLAPRPTGWALSRWFSRR